jgi:hypothetical protein
MSPLKVATLILIVTASLLPANASLLSGTSATVTYYFPDTSTIFAGPQTATVNSTTEFVNFAGLVNIDISDTNILLTFTRNGGPNFVSFDGPQFIFAPTLSSVSINPSSTFTAFTSSDLTLSGNVLWVNFAGLFVPNASTLSLDVTGSVPEPSSLLLVGTGGLGFLLGAIRRKFRI